MESLRFFNVEEFACPCGCGRADMDPKFLLVLDLARQNAGIAFRITSGFRCEAHNREVGGVPGSAHIRGLAADIACADPSARYRILTACLSVGLTRFEVGPAHIHVDRDNTKLPWVIDLASAHRGPP